MDKEAIKENVGIEEKYETLKKKKAGTILLTMTELETLLDYIKNKNNNSSDNPYNFCCFFYNEDELALHL